jgi:hypothetical protein
MYHRLVEVKDRTLQALSSIPGTRTASKPTGIRQECRFSLYGLTFERAVDSVMHVFASDWSPFFAFTTGIPGLQLESKLIAVDDYKDLVRKRFDLAGAVYQSLFLGRANAAHPRELVYPLLADLCNTLGLNYGQR